jgi:hypothetical protein
MTINDIDAITLQYFTNQKFDIGNITSIKDDRVVNNSEKKFYKKRIIQLTKDLFKKNDASDAIQSGFNNYILSCISYFKFTDASELLQEEYEGLNIEMPEIPGDIIVDDDNIDNIDKVLFNKPVATNTLDTFINSKLIVVNEDQLPTSKVLNIRTEKFKTKGVRLKKKEI